MHGDPAVRMRIRRCAPSGTAVCETAGASRLDWGAAALHAARGEVASAR